jgi:hypothetical protein
VVKQLLSAAASHTCLPAIFKTAAMLIRLKLCDSEGSEGVQSHL